LCGPPPVDGVNPRKLPEQLCIWPRGLRTSLPVLRFVSMAAMQSDDIFTNVTKTENDSFEMGPRDCFRFVGHTTDLMQVYRD
jgi:hypothetical protein